MQFEVGVIGIRVHDFINLVDQSLVAQSGEHLRDFTAVHGFHDALFEVDGEAFIEPEIIPGGIGHKVSAPAVR